MNNPTLIQYFEWYLPEDGTLWRRCSVQAKQLAHMGINMAWLPPAYKGNGGSKDVGYAVYDIYDLGEFNQKGSIPTKYGNKEDYINCIKTMQSEGISVLADIVLNHRIGADGSETIKATEIAGNNRHKNLSGEGEKDVTVWTRFNFDGRGNTYSDFKWNWTHFDGTDWDDITKRQMLLRFHGKAWDDDVDAENGNYDYLMGADMRAHKGKDFFAVGEYWSPKLNDLLTYLNKVNKSMSLFDVPLHFHFHEISNANGNYDMASIYKDTLVDKDAWHTVTFVDNHDTQPGQALQSYVSAWFKPLAYGLILLNQHGLPCVFYGDLYGIPHDGLAPVTALPKLIYLRKVAAYGTQHDYFDNYNVVGFTREGDTEHPGSGLALLVSDNIGGSKIMYVGKHFAGQKFYNVFGKSLETTEIDADGKGLFKVDGGSISVWITKEIYKDVRINI